jgi:hypothetical protein
MSEGARSFDCTRCKGVDVACVARVGQGGGLCVAQLAAHGTGQVGVGRLPALDAIRVGPFRVEEYRVAQLGDGIVAAAAEQLAMRSISAWPTSARVTARASASVTITGSAGGWITRSLNTGPFLAVPLTGQPSMPVPIGQQSPLDLEVAVRYVAMRFAPLPGTMVTICLLRDNQH